LFTVAASLAPLLHADKNLPNEQGTYTSTARSQLFKLLNFEIHVGGPQ
jgi:hypothetical protein